MDTSGNIRRSAELDLYTHLYKHPSCNYGNPVDRVDMVEKRIVELNNDYHSILDVSAGRGQLARKLQKTFPDSYVWVSEGIDYLVNMDLRDFKHTVFKWVLPNRCPIQGSPWDLVICSDVLEHLLPEDTKSALRELARVCHGELLLTIALYPCSWKLLSGQRRETHINLRSAVEWIELFDTLENFSMDEFEPTDTDIYVVLRRNR